jgi:hypothetical protein
MVNYLGGECLLILAVLGHCSIETNLGILSRRGPAILFVPAQNKQILWIPALENSMGMLPHGYCTRLAITD